MRGKQPRVWQEEIKASCASEPYVMRRVPADQELETYMKTPYARMCLDKMPGSTMQVLNVKSMMHELYRYVQALSRIQSTLQLDVSRQKKIVMSGKLTVKWKSGN
ncbi:hypothetical protein AB6A40_002425 [Gnathostoma spinigerum]|uniref:Uncharacterized protein n=1 Tax=Gnathostoma spinigerum TaxID=75299 RepID=A0ABD6EE98_9BILA